MTKENKPDYGHITDKIVEDVRKFLSTNQFSTKEAYRLANLVFKREDKVQTCGTCVKNRVRDLRAFLAAYEGKTGTKAAAPAKVPADTGERKTVRLVNGGTALVGMDGKAKSYQDADGRKLVPGTYDAVGGGRLVVNVRSARFEEGGPASAEPIELVLADGTVGMFDSETNVTAVNGEPLAAGNYPLENGDILIVKADGLSVVMERGEAEAIEVIELVDDAGTVLRNPVTGAAFLGGDVLPEGLYEAVDGSAWNVDAAGIMTEDLS